MSFQQAPAAPAGRFRPAAPGCLAGPAGLGVRCLLCHPSALGFPAVLEGLSHQQAPGCLAGPADLGVQPKTRAIGLQSPQSLLRRRRCRRSALLHQQALEHRLARYRLCHPSGLERLVVPADQHGLEARWPRSVLADPLDPLALRPQVRRPHQQGLATQSALANHARLGGRSGQQARWLRQPLVRQPVLGVRGCPAARQARAR